MSQFKKTFSFILLCSFSLSLFARNKLLVILNKNAGKGEAVEIYEEKIKEQLETRYELEVFIGERGKEAYEHILQHPNLFEFSGIVGVGGDGTQSKIFKALSERENSDGGSALELIPVGVIPAGSGNALAGSIFHMSGLNEKKYNVQTMLEALLDRRTENLSLWHYRTDLGKSGLSFLGLSFGILSDIDIKSEPFRKLLGNARFDFVGAFEWFFGNKSYTGELAYIDKEYQVVQELASYRQVWALNIPRGSQKIIGAPDAKLDDDFLHLMRVKTLEADWCQLKGFLERLKTDHLDLDYVSSGVKVRELTLNASEDQYFVIDGKAMKDGTRSVTMTLYPKKAKVFSLYPRAEIYEDTL